MIMIRGKGFSEDTIAEALQKHCNFEQPYVFQSGDIVICNGQPRIILKRKTGLVAFCTDGATASVGHYEFEVNNYVKIISLNDFKEN